MKKTCIIIEDNPAFVKVLETFIGRLDSMDIVGIFPDSIGAAMSIFRNKPDLIFLDIGISGLSGPEMLETLDFKPKTIVISNHPEDSFEPLDSHIDAYLQKPVQFEDFKRVVEGVLTETLAD